MPGQICRKYFKSNLRMTEIEVEEEVEVENIKIGYLIF